MKKGKPKLPTGLFYRRRRDGTYSDIIWCWYYTKGRAQPIKESTESTDVENAKRFLFARKAEHPTARAQRIASDTVTVSDALALLAADRKKREKWVQDSLVAGLWHALGHLKIGELRRVHLDDVCDRWQGVGIDYPDRK